MAARAAEAKLQTWRRRRPRAIPANGQHDRSCGKEEREPRLGHHGVGGRGEDVGAERRGRGARHDLTVDARREGAVTEDPGVAEVAPAVGPGDAGAIGGEAEDVLDRAQVRVMVVAGRGHCARLDELRQEDGARLAASAPERHRQRVVADERVGHLGAVVGAGGEVRAALLAAAREGLDGLVEGDDEKAVLLVCRRGEDRVDQRRQEGVDRRNAAETAVAGRDVVTVVALVRRDERVRRRRVDVLQVGRESAEADLVRVAVGVRGARRRLLPGERVEVHERVVLARVVVRGAIGGARGSVEAVLPTGGLACDPLLGRRGVDVLHVPLPAVPGGAGWSATVFTSAA